MTCSPLLHLLGSFSVASLLSVAAFADTGSLSLGAKTSGNVTAGRLADAKDRASNWMVPGGEFGGEHFSALSQINTDSINKLGLAWATDIDSAIGLVAEPLVVDGVIYVSGVLSVVHALDAVTGKLLWRFDPEVSLLDPGAAMSSRFNRGVAVWEGKVFVGTGDCRVVAIDAKNGTKLWDSVACTSSPPAALAGITGAPRAADGKVFIGYLGSDTGARGSVVAFDANTGEQLWRFWTVPGDPKDGGFETPALETAAKTWPQGWAPMGGGAVWDAMNYDPVLDQLVIGTASTMPLNQTKRGTGDALYTNSVIALDADTGEYRWHYQTTPDDSWDYDATMPKIITEVNWQGKQRRVVFEAPKNGFFYVLDAATGELLAADKIAKATWASHIDMKTGRPVVNHSARWWLPEFKDQATDVYPSGYGARNWEPMAYSPDTGLVYMPVGDTFSSFCDTDSMMSGCDGKDSLGQGPDEVLPPNIGHLSAWDPVKREMAWVVDHQLPYNGGALATAGGLVFQGLGDGQLVAYSAKNGGELWSSATGSNISAAPVTFTAGGEQYVVAAIGAGGGMRIIANRHTTTKDSLGPARVVAYKLGGKAKMPVTVADNTPIPKPPARIATTPEQIAAAEGAWTVAGCEACHGGNAIALTKYRGEHKGAIPDLRYSPVLHSGWDAVLQEGALESQGMPNMGKTLGIPKELTDLIRAYVIEQAWKAYDAEQVAAKQ